MTWNMEFWGEVVLQIWTDPRSEFVGVLDLHSGQFALQKPAEVYSWLPEAYLFPYLGMNWGHSTYQFDPGRPTGVGHHISFHFNRSVVLTAAAIHTEVFLSATTVPRL